ncbi:MAG: cyanophycinase [Planctomycetes bacterium]|nr:cyanophycinase [Planctomycetota bacterium]
MNPLRPTLFALLLAALFAACAAPAPAPAAPPAAAGTLLLIGGGLDDDCRDVFTRLLALAARPGPPHVVVVTAATGDQEDVWQGKLAALRTWAPTLPVEVVRRETPTAATVAAIDRATALLFTGGDQSRITARYRPDGADTPERQAMLRLLQRGGVVAGASAGCAMQGERMLLGGDSTAALGPEGPRVGPGMGFVTDLVTDSHFFERDRLGRLVAALEQSDTRLGIGVGEDACVEIDLGTGLLRGIGPRDSLLVDVGGLVRDGAHRRAVHARCIGPDTVVDLRALAARQPQPGARPAAAPVEQREVEPGQDRQLASWRLCRAAAHGPQALTLAGHRLVAWPAADGGVTLDVEVTEP